MNGVRGIGDRGDPPADTGSWRMHGTPTASRCAPPYGAGCVDNQFR